MKTKQIILYDNVTCMCLSEDWKFVAYAFQNNFINILNFSTSKCILTINVDVHLFTVNSLCFSHNSKQITSCSNDMTIKIYSLILKKTIKTLVGHTFRVNHVTYSHDDKNIVSSSTDNTARIWNVETGECLHILEGHHKRLSRAVYNSYGTQIATVSTDNTVRLWCAISGKCLDIYIGSNWIKNGITYSSDGKKIAYSSSNCEVVILDILSKSPMFLKNNAYPMINLKYSPDDRFLLGGSYDDVFKIWNAKTGECIYISTEYNSDINCISCSPDSRTVAFCYTKNEINSLIILKI